MEDVQTELILSDLEVTNKRRSKSKFNKDKKEEEVWTLIYDHLNENEPVRTLNFTPEQWNIVNTLPLITAKPIIFACNIDAESYLTEEGNEMANKFKSYVNEKYPGLSVVKLCSTLESDISEIRGTDGEEVANEFMEMAGLEGSALDLLLE